MTPEIKIRKVIESCEKALELIEQGEKRLAVGMMDHGKDAIEASIYLMLAEIELDEE
ncbi:hypothetical protein D3C84_1094630 [compost metagenome]